MRYIVFDVEATGTHNGAQVCQLASILCDGDNITAGNRYFTVDEMNIYAQKVHGLSIRTLHRLSQGRRFEDDALEIRREFYWADLLVGHGVAGDVSYLTQEFEDLGMTFPQRRRFCTMNYFTGKFPELDRPEGGHKPPNLTELWEHYELTEDDITEESFFLFGGGAHPHDARFDATATYLALRCAAEAGDLPAWLEV